MQNIKNIRLLQRTNTNVFFLKSSGICDVLSYSIRTLIILASTAALYFIYFIPLGGTVVGWVALAGHVLSLYVCVRVMRVMIGVVTRTLWMVCMHAQRHASVSGYEVRVKARAFVFGAVETGQSFYEEVVQQYYHEIHCT